MSQRLSETWLRSIVKSLTWRLFSCGITFVIALFITHHLVYALSISVSDSVVKLFTYFYHERIWTRIQWGTYKLEES